MQPTGVPTPGSDPASRTRSGQMPPAHPELVDSRRSHFAAAIPAAAVLGRPKPDRRIVLHRPVAEPCRTVTAGRSGTEGIVGIDPSSAYVNLGDLAKPVGDFGRIPPGENSSRSAVLIQVALHVRSSRDLNSDWSATPSLPGGTSAVGHEEPTAKIRPGFAAG